SSRRQSPHPHHHDGDPYERRVGAGAGRAEERRKAHGDFGKLTTDSPGWTGKSARPTLTTSLRDHFDRRHCGIPCHRNELQQQLALRVRLKPPDLPYQRPILPSLFEDVQIRQNRLAIAEDVEFTIAGRCRGCTTGGRVVLDEMQSHRIPAWRNGNRVGEVAPAFGLVELRIIGAVRGFLAGADLSSFEVSVGTPPV